MENSNISLEKDEAFEIITERFEKIKKNGAKLTSELIKVMTDVLNQEDNDIDLPEVVIAISNITTCLCKDMISFQDGNFEDYTKRSSMLVSQRMVPSILPEKNGGILKDGEDFIDSDASIVMSILNAATMLDYAVWTSEMSSYSQIKETLNKKGGHDNE